MKIVNAQELIDHIVSETNIHAAQKERNFLTNHDKLKAFLGINCLIGINKLLSVASYWEVDHYIGNEWIKNVMTRQSFQDILQDLHFANNDYDDKSDKGRALYVIFGNTIILRHQNLPLFLLKSSMERISILDIVAPTFSRPAT